MHFAAGYRKGEDASYHQLFFGTQDVTVVLVQCIHYAWFDVMGFVSDYVCVRAGALYAIDIFEVILVLKRAFRVRL